MNWSRREAFSPSPMGCLQDAYATYIKLAKLWGNYSHTDGQRLTNGQWFKECRRFTQRDIQPYGTCGLMSLRVVGCPGRVEPRHFPAWGQDDGVRGQVRAALLEVLCFHSHRAPLGEVGGRSVRAASYCWSFARFVANWTISRMVSDFTPAPILPRGVPPAGLPCRLLSVLCPVDIRASGGPGAL